MVEPGVSAGEGTGNALGKTHASDYLETGTAEPKDPSLANSKSVSFGGVYDMQTNAEEGKVPSPNMSSMEPLGGEEAFMGHESAQGLLVDDDEEVKDEKEGDGEKEGEAEGEESEYEMVEEEGEEEIDEMEDPDRAEDDGESPKKKVKVKRMVKRKKKKVQASPRIKDKQIQMPEWTEALEIEYMNKD